VRKLKIGIIGAGGQGRKHLFNCLRLENIKLTAVADTSQYILSKLSPLNIKTYRDYTEMLEKNEFDAVIISLPNHLHKECCILSAEKGCDILIEKPMSRTYEEGKQIADNIKKSGVNLLVGMCHRFIPGIQELKEAIEKHTFGQIEFASAAFFTGPFASGRRVPEWLFDQNKLGGGALLDAGCHLIDLFLWFFGDVRSINGYIESNFNFDYDDYAEVMMRFKNGTNALAVSSWRTRIPSYRVEVIGESGRKVVFSEKFGILDLGLRKGFTSFAKRRIIQRIKGRPFLPLGDDIYYDELDYFANCILKDEQPIPTTHDWLKVSLIIDNVYQSNRQRNTVLENSETKKTRRTP
jgi:predicted dehydrogenase